MSRRAWGVMATTALVLAALGIGWLAFRPSALAPVATPDALGSPTRGAALAEIGNCAACHTAPGGAAYAGGRAIATGFGTIYATNITPARSGVGGWSYAAFRRAMTEGVSRDGHFLYPAFPYTHFRRLDEADLADLYAFVMRRPPVEAATPRNRLYFPFGFRPLLAGWNWLFLRAETPEPSPSPAWARGRYLVEGLAHCGACHSPRGWLGEEARGRAFGGGWSDGWYAPPLNGETPAPRAWTADDLYAYLRAGLSDRHAAAAGPMGAVAHALGQASDDDVRAIAAYVASRMPQADRAVKLGEAAPSAGAALFEGACAACHGEGAPMMQHGRPPLTLGTSLYESTPRDTLAVALRGLSPPVGRSGPYMPAFADTLDDAHIAEIAAYLRARFTDLPPWPQDLQSEARQARQETAP